MVLGIGVWFNEEKIASLRIQEYVYVTWMWYFIYIFIQEAAQILNLTSPAGLIEIVGFSKTKQTPSLNVIFH